MAPVIAGEGRPNICIDFGTSLSKAALLAGGSPTEPLVAPLQIGAAARHSHPLMTPSIIFVDQGRIFFGPTAFARARAAISFKRNPLVSFKAIFTANDLDELLNWKVPPSVDPTGTLRQRDALTLYLAYLLRLMRHAIIAQPALRSEALVNAELRYTSPRWRRQDAFERHMDHLFAAARAIADHFSDQLVGDEGVSIAQTKDALDKAAGVAISPVTCVLESHAIAAAYARLAPAPARHLLVIDMGAGTTDLAGYRCHDRELIDIPGTRQTSTLANDEIDRALVYLLTEKAGKRAKHPDVLWRAAELERRNLKEDIFEKGRCRLRFEHKDYELQRDTLMRELRPFLRGLAETCQRSLDPVLAAAAADKATDVSILLAGGGSHLPFVREVAANLKTSKGVKLRVESFGHDWTLPYGDPAAVRASLPQIGVALGGALAAFTDAKAAQAPA